MLLRLHVMQFTSDIVKYIDADICVCIDIIEYSYMLCIDIVGYIDIRSDLEMGIRMKNESPLLQIGQRVERISLFLKVCENRI